MAFCVSKRTLRFCRLCGMLAGGDYRRRLMRMSGEAVQVAASSSGDRLSPTLLHVLAICSHVRSGRDARQNPRRPNDLLRKAEARVFRKAPENTRLDERPNSLAVRSAYQRGLGRIARLLSVVEYSNTTRNGRPAPIPASRAGPEPLQPREEVELPAPSSASASPPATA